MRSTGIVRELDQLGRIVIPIELRRMLEIEEGDSVEVFVNDQTVIFKKYSPGCLFCSSLEHNYYFRGKMVCKNCVSEVIQNTAERIEHQQANG